MQMWDAVPNGSAENDRPMSAPLALAKHACLSRRPASVAAFAGRLAPSNTKTGMTPAVKGTACMAAAIVEAIVQGSHRSQRNPLSCRPSGIRHTQDLGEAIRQNSARMQWREGERHRSAAACVLGACNTAQGFALAARGRDLQVDQILERATLVAQLMPP